MGSFNKVNSHCQRQEEEEDRILNRKLLRLETKEESWYYDHHLHQQPHHHPTSSTPLHLHSPFNVLLEHLSIGNNRNDNTNISTTTNNNNKNKIRKATSSSITSIVVLLFVFLPAITRVDTSIITKVKIPQYVILGSTVHLYCVFDLQNGTDLYMLKWLKNDKEFYRSVPKALQRPNRRRMFYVEGVKVDIENSKIIPPGNLHQMALQEVQLSTSGRYTCQITLDAPPFQFTSLSGNMTVISIPERFPVISGNKGHQNYRLGERVQLNCTCYDTHPPATLKWFINDRQVPESYLIHYLPSKSLENQGLFHATLGLDFTVEEMHYKHTSSSYSVKRFFKNNAHESESDSEERELWVKCEATMPPLGANKSVYPFTRNVFLGSLAQSFNRFDSILSSSSSSSSSLSTGKYKSYEFNHLCVLLLNAWLVHDYNNLVTIISSSLAVILRSLFIKTRIDITSRYKKHVAIDSNLLLLLLSLLLMWCYNYFLITTPKGDDHNNSLKL